MKNSTTKVALTEEQIQHKRAKEKEYRLKYAAKDPEKYKQMKREAATKYYEANRELQIQRVIDYQRRKYNEDPQFRWERVQRVKIGHILRAIRDTNNLEEKVIAEYGCTLTEFKQHIESQFHSGMSWENFGTHFVIDHQISLGCATTDYLKAAVVNYKNIQPMLISDHKKKSAKEKRLKTA